MEEQTSKQSSFIDVIGEEQEEGMVNRVIYSVIGSPRESLLEHRLFSAVSLLNGFANIGGLLSLFVLGLNNTAVISAVVGLIFFGFYYFSRFRFKSRQLYYPYILVTAIFVFITSLQSEGTGGGGHYYIIAGGVIAIILANNKLQVVLSILLFIITSIVLIAIEQYDIMSELPSGLISQYQNLDVKMADIAGNFIFVQILICVLVLVLKYSMNEERKKAERLLLNILPASVAEELKKNNRVEPLLYENVTVLFTDFVGFTKTAEKATPQELISQLDDCFRGFDKIISTHKLEKIKTIGDAYMAVSGLPSQKKNHAVYAVLAALKMQEFLKARNAYLQDENLLRWQMRIGLHSGPVVAGIIGTTKFAYDIWGDAVNTAARLESTGEPGSVNISESTYELIKDFVDCEYRGDFEAKNKGKIKMYFVKGLRKEILKNKSDVSKDTPTT